MEWRPAALLQQFLESFQPSLESQKLLENAKRKYGVIEVEPRTFEVVLSRERKIFNNGEISTC